MTNPHRAFVDPNSGDRIYVGIDPRDRYVSVTSVLNALPKQLTLVPWAAKVVAETAGELIDQMNEGSTFEGETNYLGPYYDHDEGVFDVDLIANDLKHAWEWERDSAGEIGDECHDALDRLLGNSGGNAALYEALLEAEEVTETTRKRLGLVLDFLLQHTVNVVRTEFTMYNDSHGYAGSCDLAAYIDGVPYIIDIKTGTRVYPQTALQLAAYARGDYILSDTDDDKHPVPFAGTSIHDVRGGVLHLRERTAKLVEVDISDELFDCFLSLVLVKRLWLDTGIKEAIGKTLWTS